jgi:hypothetical protein
MRRILRTRHRMKCDEGEESGTRSQEPGVPVSPPIILPTFTHTPTPTWNVGSEQLRDRSVCYPRRRRSHAPIDFIQGLVWPRVGVRKGGETSTPDSWLLIENI